MYRRISAIVASTLIAFVIIAYMLMRVWNDLLAALEHIILAYLAIAVLICLFAWWLRGLRYKSILGSIGIRVSTAFSTASIFVSQTANLIVPARLGDLVRVFILKHEYQATYAQGISSLVVERLFDIIMVALLGVISLPFVLNVPDWFYLVIVLPLIIGGIFFGILLFIGRMRTENRYISFILTMLEEVRKASLTLRAIIVLSISSLIIWLLDAGVCAAIALMFGQDIPFLIIVLAIVIGNLVKAIPLTPGGVGTYELALAVTFSLVGVAPAIATLIAVIDHLVKNLVTLAGGIISIYFFGDWVVAVMKKAYRKELRGDATAGD